MAKADAMSRFSPPRLVMVRVASAFAVAVALTAALSGCTKGGQFDPQELFSSDVFDSKKKLKGDREPVFPDGVPGTQTGVPPDLVKGYQPPPDTDAQQQAVAPPPPEPPKPKPKPKPKVALQKPPNSTPTRISIGSKTGDTAPAAAPAQTDWPAPPAPGQTAQPAWPAAPQTAPQQTAQPAQSPWPNPPAPSTSQ
jgi:hypothetical protein